jgi:protein-disulfide isomerase
MADENSITIGKDTLYGIVIAGLAALLLLSIFTQGFGLVKAPAQQAGTQAAQPSGGSQPSGGTQPSAAAGSGGTAAAGSPGNMKDLMDDDMKLGSDSAPVVIVEFSDFQCPFCRSFFENSFPSIKKDYIDTGKVQFVFRDFPLSFHPAAEPSAEAVECAEDQSKGWELHDKIFEEQAKQGQGTVQFSVSDIKSWAAQISGLDTSAFNSCLDSGKYANEVQADEDDGVAAGVRGTPAFLIGKRDGSDIVPISGAQPYSVFKSTIDQLLQ